MDFCIILVIASIFCVGYVNRPEAFELNTVEYQVSNGETIWDICDPYFYQQNRYTEYNEFVWYVRRDNNLLGWKFIHSGDVIKIKLYSRKGVKELWKNLNL